MYVLVNDVNDMLDTGIVPNKRMWKNMVKKIVESIFFYTWIAECHLYSTFKLFEKIVTNNKMNVWWVVCKHNPRLRESCVIMVKLITDNHNMNCGRRQYVNNSRLCQLCDSDEWNNIYVNLLKFVCGLYKSAESMRTV